MFVCILDTCKFLVNCAWILLMMLMLLCKPLLCHTQGSASNDTCRDNSESDELESTMLSTWKTASSHMTTVLKNTKTFFYCIYFAAWSDESAVVLSRTKIALYSSSYCSWSSCVTQSSKAFRFYREIRLFIVIKTDQNARNDGMNQIIMKNAVSPVYCSPKRARIMLHVYLIFWWCFFESLLRGPSRCNRDLCVVATSSALPSRPDIYSELVEKERVRSMDSHQRARAAIEPRSS
jgi:hypothetical protein